MTYPFGPLGIGRSDPGMCGPGCAPWSDNYVRDIMAEIYRQMCDAREAVGLPRDMPDVRDYRTRSLTDVFREEGFK